MGASRRSQDRDVRSAATPLHSLRAGAVSGLGALLVGLVLSSPALGDECSDHLVASWAASPSNAARSLEDQSMRMIVTPHLSGSTVQLGISNRLGEDWIVVRDVRLAKATGGSQIDPLTDTPVTFGGSTRLILGRGRDTLSDPIYFPVESFQKVAVSAYVRRPIPRATQHAAASQISYLSPKGSGDVAAEADGASFDHRSQHWFLIDELDVSAPADSGAVVALGDSITDGVRSPVGQDMRYPDYLTHRLTEAGLPLTAINSGISGNALSVDAGSRLPMGPAALSRLNADATSVPGARAVIVEGGLNDLT